MALHIPAHFNIAEHFLDRPAAQHPRRMAIAGEPAPVTCEELSALANRAGNAIRAEGCGPGQRVLLALPDSAEFIAAFFGAAKVGAIAVPVNPLSRGADFAYYAADCGAAVAIVHASVLEEFLSARESGVPERIVVVGDGQGAGVRADFAHWSEWTQKQSSRLEPARTRATDPAFILYTSGSTGGPKGAVHWHQDMLATSETFARGILNITEHDRTLSVSKLFFAYGLGNGMYFPLGAGASTVLNPERPRPEKIIELVEQHRPTLFFSVPTFYAALLREAGNRKVDFSSVRLAVSAGEALPVEIFEQFKKRFGLEILDAIGSTEMLHMFISNVPGKIRPGCCGVPLPGYDAKIVDETPRQLPRAALATCGCAVPAPFPNTGTNRRKPPWRSARTDGWLPATNSIATPTATIATTAAPTT